MSQKILKLRNKAVHVKNERDVLAKGYDSPWLVHLLYSFQGLLVFFFRFSFFVFFQVSKKLKSNY